MKDKFMLTIREHNMLNSGDSVLIALSGGIDSTVMTWLLHEARDTFKLKLYAFHLNHLLRPGEAEKEAAFVKGLCERFSIKSFITEYDVKEYAKENGLSVQVAARKIRYELLDELRDKHNIDKIATAHNADDRAETVLIRLIRGTAGANAAGIAPVRDSYIIRPLIDCFRSEIIHYADENNIRYMTDSSNLKTDYLRNKVRLELFPYLIKDFNENIVKNILNFSKVTKLENDLINDNVKVKYKEALTESKESHLLFSIKKLSLLEPAIVNRIIAKAYYSLAQFGHALGFKHIEKVNYMIGAKKPHLDYKLPGGVTVSRSYNDLTFTSSDLLSFTDYEFTHDFNDITLIADSGLKVTSEVIESSDALKLVSKKGDDEEYVDADRVRSSVTIRNFRPGDMIRPLNMGGTKKLKDIFIDKKIPLKVRRTAPVLISNGEIILVQGVCVSDSVKVTAGTKRAMKFTFFENG